MGKKYVKAKPRRYLQLSNIYIIIDVKLSSFREKLSSEGKKRRCGNED